MNNEFNPLKSIAENGKLIGQALKSILPKMIEIAKLNLNRKEYVIKFTKHSKRKEKLMKDIKELKLFINENK